MNELGTFFIVIGVLFTIGVILTLSLITRQVLRSEWIDSRAPKMLWIFLAIVIATMVTGWSSLLIYLEIV